MRRSSVANGFGSLSMVATAMPQQLSSMVVSGPPATTPISGLPTSSGRQSSCIEASPRATASTFRPSALLCGMVSENSCWNSATRSSSVVRDLAMPVSYRLVTPCEVTVWPKSRHSALTALNSRSYLHLEAATDRPVQGTETGYFSSAHPQRAGGRLHLWPGRARIRPDLQGNGAGELRPGRSADAGRVRGLHGGRVVGPRLLARLPDLGGDDRRVRRLP